MADTLARLNRARTMLARARTLEDVKKIHDMAEAARVLMKAAHLGREAQYQAAEVALLAAHKAGEILKHLDRAKPKAKGGRVTDSPYWRALKETGTAYRTAQRWQTIARVPLPNLERYFAQARKKNSSNISAEGFLSTSKEKKHKRPSRFTHKIVVPLVESEWNCIRQFAGFSFDESDSDPILPEQLFIRLIVKDYLKKFGLFYRSGPSGFSYDDEKSLRQHLADFLKSDPRAYPFEESPLGQAVKAAARGRNGKLFAEERDSEFGPFSE